MGEDSSEGSDDAFLSDCSQVKGVLARPHETYHFL